MCLTLPRVFSSELCSLHNMGHNLLAFIHDPDHRHLEDYAVMADVATSMRDPVFYRWHSFLDTIFVKFKNQLQSYQTDDLKFDGINVTTVNVRITSRSPNVPPNILVTFWQKSSVDLGASLDFGPGDVYAQVFALWLRAFHLVFNSIDIHFSVYTFATCTIRIPIDGNE